MRKIIVISVTLLLLGVGVWYWQSGKSKKTNDPQYSTEKATKGDVAVAFDVEGKIAYERWDLNFSQSGVVKKINVSLGDEVKKNQVLATLDTSRADGQIAQAQAQTQVDALGSEGLSKTGADYKVKKKAYDNAKDKLNAEEKLYDEYVAQNGEDSVQALAQKVKVKAAEAELDNAKAQLAQTEEAYKKALYQLNKSQAAQGVAQADAEDFKIVSPISGAVVVSIGGSEGMTFFQSNSTSSADPFITLINPEKFWFEAFLEDIDALKVSNGMKAYISLDAYPDKKFEGSVEFISPIATVDNNGITSYKAIISFATAENEKVLADMIGSAKLVSKEVKDVVVISNAAVYLKNSKQMVSVKKGDLLEEREVVTGFTNGKKVEIKSGVNTGEEVIIFN